MDKTTKRQPLGRGLGALIPGADRAAAVTPATPTNELPIGSIVPNPWQPRRRFTDEAIQELADSIRERGIVQPLVVRRAGNHYELIAGERRLRAAGRAGLTTVPVVIRNATDQDMLEVALIENIQREDLNPIEEALAYRRLADELVLTQEEVATRVGKERSTVANSLRLLQLPQPVQEAVEAGQLSAGHARAVAMAGSAAAMIELARKAIAQKLTVRQVERLAQALKKPATAAKAMSPEQRDIEDRLAKALGTKVRITQKSKTAGVVTIEYFSLDQFDGLLRRLGL